MSGRSLCTLANRDNLPNDGDLKLYGDKMKLEVRPLSRASSRCALLGPASSRPVSAVPLLNLYRNDDYDAGVKSRRPFSADCIDLKNASSHVFVRQESSDSSADFEENSLPSSNLFQNLLKEPIKSWRQHAPSKDDFKRQTSDDLPSIISEESLGTKIQSVAQKFPKTLPESEPKRDANLSVMKPGLTSKPPLPKKPDSNHPNTKKVDFSFKESSKEHFDAENGLANEYLTEETKKDSFGNDLHSIKSIAYEIPFWEKSQNVNYAKRDGYKSPTNIPKLNLKNVENQSEEETEIDKDLMVQNWILSEDVAAENDAAESEHITNCSFKDVYEKQSEMEKEANKMFPKKDEEDNVFDQKFKNFFRNELELDLDFHNSKDQKDSLQKNFQGSGANLHDVNARRNLQKCNKHLHNQLTSNLQTDLQSSQIKETKLDCGATKLPKAKRATKPEVSKSKSNFSQDNMNHQNLTKQKFTAKQMKTITDSEIKSSLDEVTSWMSRTQSKIGKEIIKVVSKDDKRMPKVRAVNYLDFLSNLEELQDNVATLTDVDREIERENEMPEQDSDKGYETSTDNGTYDEIVSILEVLEAEDKKSHIKMDSIKEIVNRELSDSKETDYKENAVKRSSLINKGVLETQSNSSTNYNHLLQFLDEVDRNCNESISLAQERVQKVTQMLENTFSLETLPKMEDLLSHTNLELAQHVIDLSLRVKDKSSSIAFLQKELSGLRDQVVRSNKQTEQIIKEKLKAQKEEYEATVRRHQKFIDQLIADKKSLNQQCEGLISEMKILEDRFASNMKAAEHRHQVELQKAKEMHVAGEKIRRDRWIDNKTQKIKDMTVKSIAPELENMSRRQQQELSDLRALHKKEIEDMELRAARKTQHQLEVLRTQMIEEREKTLAHERDVMRIRYEKLVESEEKSYQEQRRRVSAEVAKRQAEFEEREASLEAEKEKAISQVREEHEEKLQAVIRRHNNELKLLKETTELEMDAFRNNLKKQQSLELAEREAALREKCRKERDREIESVIERLEMESNENKAQMEQSSENRIRRIKEKFQNELRDLEASEKEAKNKYAQVKTQLVAAEDTVISLKASIKQLETQLNESREVSLALSGERHKMREVVRGEIKNEVEALEREVATLKGEHERELQQVYSRVRVSVARKDELITELTRDVKALQEKCVYLESMLEQQRKEYLMK